MGLDKDKELDELLNLFSHDLNSLFIANPPFINIISSDPNDNKFIECVVGFDADHNFRLQIFTEPARMLQH